MKICVSSTGNHLKSLVDGRFGRCQYFLIIDTEKEEIKVLENQGAVSPGGAGIAAAQQVVDQGVEYVITGNVGPNAMQVLNAAGIKIYRGEGMEIDRAVEDLKSGLLKPIDTPAPSHFGMRYRRGMK